MKVQETPSELTKTSAFFSLVRHPLKLKLYFLANLPAAFFCGLKVQHADPGSCTVSVPYFWVTKNPFHSTYFACLSMAAELSTGILAKAKLYRQAPRMSMLITQMKGTYYKKQPGTPFLPARAGQKLGMPSIEPLPPVRHRKLLYVRTAGVRAATRWQLFGLRGRSK